MSRHWTESEKFRPRGKVVCTGGKLRRKNCGKSSLVPWCRLVVMLAGAYSNAKCWPEATSSGSEPMRVKDSRCANLGLVRGTFRGTMLPWVALTILRATRGKDMTVRRGCLNRLVYYWAPS